MVVNSMMADYKHGNMSYIGNEDLMESLLLFKKKIWRVKDVARFLGCSVGHIYNLVSDEKIPKIKKGKFVYFIPEVIQSWLLEGE